MTPKQESALLKKQYNLTTQPSYATLMSFTEYARNNVECACNVSEYMQSLTMIQKTTQHRRYKVKEFLIKKGFAAQVMGGLLIPTEKAEGFTMCVIAGGGNLPTFLWHKITINALMEV